MPAKTSLLAGLATRVVLVLGLAYVSLWWSYQHFYGVFGVSPDDVGLAPTGGGAGDVFVAVLRLGLWLSIALLALGLLPVVCIGFALYAFERRKQRDGRAAGPADADAAASGQHRFPVGPTQRSGQAAATPKSSLAGWIARLFPERGRRTKSAAGLLLAIVSIVAIFIANAFFVDHHYAAVVVVLVVVITVACCVAATKAPIANGGGKAQPPHFASRWWAARQPWLLRASDLFLLLAVIGVLFVDLPNDAHKVATTALKMAGTPDACKVPAIGAPIGRFRLDVLSVHALPAEFAVATLPAGLPSQRPFAGIYLGTSNGWLVVYEKLSKTEGRILRIPTSSGVSVIANAKLGNCPGVH
jgi:hypothetical protein